MIENEFKLLETGDLVKVRGSSLQGTVGACIDSKAQVQIVYVDQKQELHVASLPFACLDVVEPVRYCPPVQSNDLPTRPRARVR